MSDDFVSAIESLKTRISTLWLLLPMLEESFNNDAESAAANARKSKTRIDIDAIGKHTLFKVKKETANELRAAAAIATKLGIELVSCRKMAIAIEGGIDVPKPEQFTFDAVVELDRLIAAIKSTNDDGKDIRKQQALVLWNAGSTWSNVCATIDKTQDWKAFSQEIKRYAESTGQIIRVGKPGMKRTIE